MKYFFLIIIFYTTSVFSQTEAIIDDFKTLLRQGGYTPLSQHSFCYDDGNRVYGQDVDGLKKIASVTKLFTTYLASETLDLHQTFETKFYISNDRLHIDGSKDPFFEEEKMVLLLQALNGLGYKSFKMVTFDADFKFYDLSLERHEEISLEKTKARIQAYFNKNNVSLIKSMLAQSKKFAEEEGIIFDDSLIPSVHATSVVYAAKNPLKKMSSLVLHHKSRPLHQILKSMNVLSKNIVAQNIYNQGNSVKKLTDILVSKGIGRKTFEFLNGSGLPIKKGKNRWDNLATCRTVLKLISLLRESLIKHNLQLSDVVAVNGGKDLGSFRERFLDYPETHQAVIAKTGTIAVASALAGMILSEKEISFAILNHTSNLGPIRKIQDHFISRMFHHLGESRPIDYFKISIFPWDGSDFLIQNNKFFYMTQINN